MTIIKMLAADQALSFDTQPTLASGDKNSVSLQVTFSSEWDGYGKSAVFFTQSDSTVYEIPLQADSCVVPWEVLEKTGQLVIGLRGVNADSGQVKTSALIKCKIVEGAPVGDGIPVEPTSDVYQQLLAAYGKMDAAYTKESAERKEADAAEKAERIAVDKANKEALHAEIMAESARIDELVAMRSGEGVQTYEAEGEATDYYWSVKIISNGVSANVSFDLHFATISPKKPLGIVLRDYPQLIPLGDTYLRLVSPSDASDKKIQCLIRSVQNTENGVWYPVIIVSNGGNTVYQLGTLVAEGPYTLANISISELIDVRVDGYGNTHSTAGESVRAQVEFALESTREMGAELQNQIQEESQYTDLVNQKLDNAIAYFAKEYRHIATYEHPAGLDVKRVEITLDKDGNTFECSEFMIFLTLPTTDEIINDYKTQFHIRRSPSENNYVVLMPQAFSRVANNVRRTRLHLYHVLDGYWATDGTFNDKSNQAGQSVPDVNSSNSGFGNIKTDWVVGKTVNSLCFDTVAYMPAGTIIEIYGK